jgi:hypothetical protein
MDWIGLAQDRDGWRAEHGNELSGSLKFWKFFSSCTTGAFSRRAELHEVSMVSNDRKRDGWWIRKDLDGKCSALIEVLTRKFSRRTWGRPWTAYVPAEFEPNSPNITPFRCINLFGALRTILWTNFQLFTCCSITCERNCIFSLISLIWKIKWGSWDHLAVCLCVIHLILLVGSWDPFVVSVSVWFSSSFSAIDLFTT